ncbi:MAG: hypothetical protein HY973_02705, partial [Candidatus Kerfeldbacteria bacterium]|nr:hypothetical protein [Candidatus Kerfeldbacteria bacterium]
TIDLTLSAQSPLYAGLTISEVGGRLTLADAEAAETLNTIGRNAKKMVDEAVSQGESEVTLTGPMAVQAYLVVFHVVVHRFGRVYYLDGRGHQMLIAAH